MLNNISDSFHGLKYKPTSILYLPQEKILGQQTVMLTGSLTGKKIARVVTHHPKGGHPPSKIYQKELCYRLEIWYLDITHKIKTLTLTF